METFSIYVPVSSDIVDDFPALAFMVHKLWEQHLQGGMRAIGPLHMFIMQVDDITGLTTFRISGPAFPPPPDYSSYGIRPHKVITEEEDKRMREMLDEGPRSF